MEAAESSRMSEDSYQTT